jgi:hypothetical protein
VMLIWDAVAVEGVCVMRKVLMMNRSLLKLTMRVHADEMVLRWDYATMSIYSLMLS